MTTMQAAIMIGLAALATQITRWTPFLLFRRRTPHKGSSAVKKEKQERGNAALFC